ncbi:uncharacterized protein LOC117894327 [Drosophila subobscura]|uniref:uncharacterized protein LOC117894327 n=1 Tax=Drosophila subobscura TaxID=7241 RepID=UPI00155A9022|nr:uncharacterized protein LOC117894327 [Drosophila subobscura]
MNLCKWLWRLCVHFFHYNYPCIAIYSSVGAVVTAYLHYQLRMHSLDLMYWKQLAETFAQEIDRFQLSMLFVIFLINAVFVFVLMSVYLRPGMGHGVDGELSLLQIKDRYARYILLRLIARLDRIQSRLAARRDGLCLQHYVRAHCSMAKAVAIFRKDARKLIRPNESEIMLPVEAIYHVEEEDERHLRRAGYYKLSIDTSDEMVKGLFNAI